jgi:hypothetical protein
MENVMDNNDLDKELLLRVSALAVFLGRGMEHLFRGGPYRALFWDEDWWGREGADWSRISEGWFSDGVIDGITTGIGIYFLVCAVFLAAAREGRGRRWAWPVWGGVFCLVLLAFALFKDKFYQVPQFMEYTLQWATPGLFLLLFFHGLERRKILLLGRIAIALTFVGHGVYALGWLPVPVHFMEMTMGILGLDEEAARLFLRIAGGLDMWVAVAMFLPGRWLRSGLVYATCWGFLTALARVVYGFQWDLPLDSLSQGLPGTVYRIAHGMVPLWVLWVTTPRYPPTTNPAVL